MRRLKIYGLLGLGFLMATLNACNGAASEKQAPVENLVVNTPAEALKALEDGNARFVQNKELEYTHMDHVKESAPHQEPFAAVVGCSDSRVPVELVFDQSVGDVFVIRTAGNSVNSDMVMGSVDYAVCHLNVKLLVVLGHSSCGGVTSAIAASGHDEGEDHGKVDDLLEVLREDLKPYLGKPELLDEAIHTHTDAQVNRILQCEHVQKRIQSGELMVKAAHYDVATGKVVFE